MEHLKGGVYNVALVIVLQQLDYHLGICLRVEGNALGDQVLLDLQIVLNNPVMNHCDPAGVAEVGVGVGVRGLAVGGPTGMTDTHRTGNAISPVGEVGQRLQPPLCLGQLQPPLRVVDGQARRVIAPIFQPGEAVQQNGGCLFGAHKSYNTTHKWFSFSFIGKSRKSVASPFLLCSVA